MRKNQERLIPPSHGFAVDAPADRPGLAQALLARFAEAGGADLPLPVRGEAPRAAAASA